MTPRKFLLRIMLNGKFAILYEKIKMGCYPIQRTLVEGRVKACPPWFDKDNTAIVHPNNYFSTIIVLCIG